MWDIMGAPYRNRFIMAESRCSRMSLQNCKDCGKLYVQSGPSSLCSPCLYKRADMVKTLRSYLASNPKKSVMDVHRELGIPLVKLLEFQKESAYLA